MSETKPLPSGYQPPASSWWVQPSREAFKQAQQQELERMSKTAPPVPTGPEVPTAYEAAVRRNRKEGQR